MKAPRVRGWRTFRATLTRPHDGDTFRVLVDTGFDGRSEPSLRLFDVYAPELAMRLPPRREPGGGETTTFVNAWLTTVADRQPKRRWPLMVATLLTTTLEPEQVTTHRRYVARVWGIDDFERTQGLDDSLTLNYQVTEFLRAHPEWTGGES